MPYHRDVEKENSPPLLTQSTSWDDLDLANTIQK